MTCMYDSLYDVLIWSVNVVEGYDEDTELFNPVLKSLSNTVEPPVSDHP